MRASGVVRGKNILIVIKIFFYKLLSKRTEQMNPRNLSVLVAVLAGCLLCVSSAENLLKSRVIVVVDSSSYQSTHSTFFNDLICERYFINYSFLLILLC